MFCGNDVQVDEIGFEDRCRAGGAASHLGHLDLCGSGLCVRLGAGASQYSDRPAGRGRPGDILPAERPHPAGDRITHKPLWAAKAGLLDAGQGPGFEVYNPRFGLRIIFDRKM